jgi:DNA-binding beta-propeller fold protein YncE
MRRMKFCALVLASAVSLWAFSVSPAFARRILFSDLNTAEIRSIELDGSNLHTAFSTNLVPTSIAYEPVANRIYWGVDIGDNYIGRANLDGSNTEILSSSDGPDSLAIDAAAGKIYFGSEDSGTVQRSNLDGAGLQALYSDPGSTYYGIAADSAFGKVYWTSTGNNRYVHRANLDGSNHEDLLTGPGPGLTFGGPFGIGLDVAAGKFYFSDEDDSHFYRANLDGTALEVFSPSGNLHPHGIALDLDNQRLYWAQEGAIGSSNLDGSNAVLYNVGGFPHSLAIVPEPSSWLLALSGLGMLVFQCRPRRRT